MVNQLVGGKLNLPVQFVMGGNCFWVLSGVSYIKRSMVILSNSHQNTFKYSYIANLNFCAVDWS